jgi:hypothetical protein
LKLLVECGGLGGDGEGGFLFFNVPNEVHKLKGSRVQAFKGSIKAKAFKIQRVNVRQKRRTLRLICSGAGGSDGSGDRSSIFLFFIIGW